MGDTDVNLDSGLALFLAGRLYFIRGSQTLRCNVWFTKGPDAWDCEHWALFRLLKCAFSRAADNYNEFEEEVMSIQEKEELERTWVLR